MGSIQVSFFLKSRHMAELHFSGETGFLEVSTGSYHSAKNALDGMLEVLGVTSFEQPGYANPDGTGRQPLTATEAKAVMFAITNKVFE